MTNEKSSAMIQTIAKKNKGCEKEEYIPGHRQREIPDRLEESVGKQVWKVAFEPTG